MSIQPAAPSTEAEEDLSDEQIEQLLQQAEVRLRGERASNALVPSNNAALTSSSKSQTASLPAPPVQIKGSIARANPRSIVSEEQRETASYGVRKVEDPIASKRKKLEQKKATAGPGWFDLPKTELTPQLKRDLQIIHMRNVLDPHRHYKKDNSRPLVPDFSVVGTMTEGPTEYFSARIPKSERNKSLTESVLAGDKESGRMKRKYNEIQEKKTSGKKAHYRRKLENRYKGKMKR